MYRIARAYEIEGIKGSATHRSSVGTDRRIYPIADIGRLIPHVT